MPHTAALTLGDNLKKVAIVLNVLLIVVITIGYIVGLIKSGELSGIVSEVVTLAFVGLVPLINVLVLIGRLVQLESKRMLLVGLNLFWVLTILVWVFFNMDGFYLRNYEDVVFGLALSLPYIAATISILRRNTVSI